MYEITINVLREDGEYEPIKLTTASRASARAIVMIAQENPTVITAVATKMSAPRIVKFKGVGDAPAPVAPKKGK